MPGGAIMMSAEDSDTLLAAVRRLVDVNQPSPEDSATVLAAVRLGWCVAEVRGRNRPGGPPLGANVGRNRFGSHELPLQIERTPAESRIAAQMVLISLATKLGVDQAADGASLSHAVDSQSRALAAARANNDPAASAQEWASLAELLYRFDAYIQDTLSVQSDLQAGGYQLGRALAECYWALDPGAPSDERWGAWSLVLGPQRCDEIELLLGRLSAYLPPNAPRAITRSVRQWQQVAASPGHRQGAETWLSRQVGVWYELAALGRDPGSYVRAYARLQNWQIAYQAIRFFWGQMVLIALAIAALAVLVVLLGSGSSTAIVNTVLAVVAAAGVSAAGLSAGRFRRDLNTDLLTKAITTLPPRP